MLYIHRYRNIFGYARAHQVSAVEPSFTDRNRLAVAECHKFHKLRILAENSVINDCMEDAYGTHFPLRFCLDLASYVRLTMPLINVANDDGMQSFTGSCQLLYDRAPVSPCIQLLQLRRERETVL